MWKMLRMKILSCDEYDENLISYRNKLKVWVPMKILLTVILFI